MRLALNRRTWRWAALTAALVGLDVYFLGWRLAEVQGNVEAQFIIVTPAFIVQHLLMRRRVDRQHAETARRLDELHDKHDETAAKVHQLHALHIHGEWPEDRHRAR